MCYAVAIHAVPAGVSDGAFYPCPPVSLSRLAFILSVRSCPLRAYPMLSSTMPFPFHPDPLADVVDSDTESDCCTEMSIDSSAPSSRTSVSFSMRSPSPTPSVFSVTSSLRAQAYRQEYGRGLNNYSDVYRLPADEEELDRLGSFAYPSFCLSHPCKR